MKKGNLLAATLAAVLALAGCSKNNEPAPTPDDPTGITTFDALTAAIADATGTKEAPTVITLGADITVPVLDNGAYNIPSINIGSEDGATIRHIRIEGHSLIAGGDGIRMMQVGQGSSLALANITLDGAGKGSNVALINVCERATLVLGNGTTLTNLQPHSLMGMFPSRGVTLPGASSLTVESGATISDIGGYAIEVNSIQSTGCITLNGGTFKNNTVADIRLVGINSNVAPVQVTTLPEGSGTDKKPTLEIIFPNMDRESGAIASGTPLKENDFELKKVMDNDGNEVTSECEFFMESGILKIRKKP